MRYETTSIRIGFCHLTEIGTVALRSTLSHYTINCSRLCFPGIRHNPSNIFEHVQNVTTVYDSLRNLELSPTESQRVSHYTKTVVVTTSAYGAPSTTSHYGYVHLVHFTLHMYLGSPHSYCMLIFNLMRNFPAGI